MISPKKIVSYLFVTLLVWASVSSCNSEDPVLPDTTDDTVTDPVDDDPDPDPEPEDYVATFGGSSEDTFSDILQASDGNYMLVGATKSIDGDIIDKKTTDFDYWILKVTPEGDILWSKTYGGTADDKAASISPTTDGGFVVSGYTASNDGDVTGNDGFHDYWLVKLDAEGNLQWEQSFGFSGSDQAFQVIQTSDGGYFATGYLDVSSSGGQGNDDRSGTRHGVGEFWGIRMDASGAFIWRRYFGGTNNDRSYDVVETADGGFLMMGASESDDFDITDSKGSYDYWAVRINGDGDLVWAKSFGGSGIDVSYSVVTTPEGNYIAVGDARSSDGDVTSPKGNADVWVISFDDSGNLLWERSLGGSQFETGRSIAPAAGGNYVIGGSTRSNDGDVSSNNGENDVWLVTIDASGNLLREATAGGSSLDLGNGVLYDSGMVLVGSTESTDLDISENKGQIDGLLVKRLN
ncbi:hypothetical protein [Altibacter sp. HG106]|uniref:hypothetical protein n=1 Tax=Altibacter sp. HG106 TaxID=3023937 RepID=UPI00234FB6AE|nr:hypothetical protein [Altibacter sp. HG106]MDC7995153.1 hypothetical protein [Altibacter sp. HG106]